MKMQKWIIPITFIALLLALSGCNSSNNQEVKVTEEDISKIESAFLYGFGGSDEEIVEAKEYLQQLHPVDMEYYHTLTTQEKLSYLHEHLESIILTKEKYPILTWNGEAVDTIVKIYFPDLYPTIEQQIEDEKQVAPQTTQSPII